MCRRLLSLALPLGLMASIQAAPDPKEIIRKSVAANEADWKQAPQYNFTEHDVETKGGKRTVRTYEVLMIEGSPYNRLIAVNDQPLSKAEQKREEQKLEREKQARHKESQDARGKRLAKYQRERKQDHAMLRELADAFVFKLVGEDTVDGHKVWVLAADPKPGYHPKTRDTKVLTGMRGKLWIDQSEYQWVKVQAEVIKPVSFAIFFAKVSPGTQFLLEQAPVPGAKIWLPKHFQMKVKASVLGMARNSADDETYRNYKRAGVALSSSARP